MTNPKAQKFMEDLPEYPPADLRRRFPSAGADAVDLLARMLVMRPDRRISVADALRHPYLRSLREKKVNTIFFSRKCILRGDSSLQYFFVLAVGCICLFVRVHHVVVYFWSLYFKSASPAFCCVVFSFVAVDYLYFLCTEANSFSSCDERGELTKKNRGWALRSGFCLACLQAILCASHLSPFSFGILIWACAFKKRNDACRGNKLRLRRTGRSLKRLQTSRSLFCKRKTFFIQRHNNQNIVCIRQSNAAQCQGAPCHAVPYVPCRVSPPPSTYPISTLH